MSVNAQHVRVITCRWGPTSRSADKASALKWICLPAILPICWTEASAASAPPQTPQEKWRECRPPLPATPLSPVCRICRQSEHSPGKIFPSRRVTLHRLISIWVGGVMAAYRNPDVCIELQPSKPGMDWGHWTQLLLEDLRCDLGFIDVFLNGCTLFHRWRVMLGTSLTGNHWVCMYPGLLGSFCPDLCVYRLQFSVLKT